MKSCSIEGQRKRTDFEGYTRLRLKADEHSEACKSGELLCKAFSLVMYESNQKIVSDVRIGEAIGRVKDMFCFVMKNIQGC